MSSCEKSIAQNRNPVSALLFGDQVCSLLVKKLQQQSHKVDFIETP